MENSKNIILIGGAPTTGKTTVAEQLSLELQIPWISTDQIRSILKSIADKSRWQDLFQTLPDEATVEEIVDLEIKRSEIIWQGALALIERYHPWNGCIIEGTAILPHLAKRDLAQKTQVQALFLLHTDTAKIEHLVLQRSKLPFIKTKTQSQQESKIQQIELLNRKIRADAKAESFLTIEAQTEQTFNNVMRAL